MGHPHSHCADVHLVSGHHFADEAEAAPPQETSCTGRDEHLGLQIEPVEGGKVEVVVVGVRDEDHADAVDCSPGDRFLPAEVDDPAAEHRVGDDHEAVEPDRGAAVPEPRQRSGVRVSCRHGESDARAAEREAARCQEGETGLGLSRRARTSRAISRTSQTAPIRSATVFRVRRRTTGPVKRRGSRGERRAARKPIRRL